MAILGAKKFQNYIDGEWVDAASGATFESTSPADGETIGVFPKSGPEDVDHAVAAAKSAYEAWRLVPAPKRGEVLFRFAQLLAEHKDDVTDLMTHEMGKGQGRSCGRRPGSHRHGLLHGRRRSPPVRPDDPVRATRQVPD